AHHGAGGQIDRLDGRRLDRTVGPQHLDIRGGGPALRVGEHQGGGGAGDVHSRHQQLGPGGGEGGQHLGAAGGEALALGGLDGHRQGRAEHGDAHAHRVLPGCDGFEQHPLFLAGGDDHLAAALHRGGAVRGPQLHRGGGGALGGVAQHEGGAVPGRGGDPQEGGLGGGFGAACEGQRAVVAGGRRGALEGAGERTGALGGRGGGVRDVLDAGHPQHGDAEVLGGGGVLEDGAVGSFDRDGGCADGAVVLLEGGGAAHGAEQQRGRGFDGHGAQRD